MVGLLTILNSGLGVSVGLVRCCGAEAASEMGIQILGRTLAADRRVAVESTRLTPATRPIPAAKGPQPTLLRLA
jgi:hypothetical protein